MIRITEGEERKQGEGEKKAFEETMAKYFTNLMKIINSQT